MQQISFTSWMISAWVCHWNIILRRSIGITKCWKMCHDTAGANIPAGVARAGTEWIQASMSTIVNPVENNTGCIACTVELDLQGRATICCINIRHQSHHWIIRTPVMNPPPGNCTIDRRNQRGTPCTQTIASATVKMQEWNFGEARCSCFARI